MRAMILGAGLGTRLRPLTDRLAKPAVPFFDRPLAGHVLRQLIDVGVTDVVVNVHHLPETLEAALRPLVPAHVKLEVVHEPVLLGTGGGVRNALMRQSARLGPPSPDEPIVLANGDVAFWPDLRAAIDRHRSADAVATLVVRRHQAAEKMGAVHVTPDGSVARILGARDAVTEPFQFTGVHVLRGDAIETLPEEGCIVRRGYIPWLAAGQRIAAHVETAPFRDCGTVAEYLAAHRDVLARRVPLPVEIEHGSFVAADATIEGTIDASVIGAGAHVAPGVILERCVVWPGTRVTASAVDAVLADDLVVT